MRKRNVCILFAVSILTGCSTNTTEPSKDSSIVQHPFGGTTAVSASTQDASAMNATTSLHASDVLRQFKEQGLPIGENISYNASNDPNGLLGQSNSYIEKITFADTRLNAELDYAKQPLGGTIEVFRTEEDAKARYTYLDNVTSSSVMSMYMYQHKTVLLRLEKRLSESQAQEYRTILNGL